MGPSNRDASVWQQDMKNICKMTKIIRRKTRLCRILKLGIALKLGLYKQVSVKYEKGLHKQVSGKYQKAFPST